jgi:hypothetical protein
MDKSRGIRVGLGKGNGVGGREVEVFPGSQESISWFPNSVSLLLEYYFMLEYPMNYLAWEAPNPQERKKRQIVIWNEMW